MKRDDFNQDEKQAFPGAIGSVIPWSWIGIIICLVAFGFFLAGCADMSRISAAQNEAGNLVSVLELPGIQCPTVVSKGEVNGGCYWPGPVAFGYGFDRHARVHEVLDHIGGLKHGKWDANKCAQILASGITQWKVGNMICRHDNGHYYERQM